MQSRHLPVPSESLLGTGFPTEECVAAGEDARRRVAPAGLSLNAGFLPDTTCSARSLQTTSPRERPQVACPRPPAALTRVLQLSRRLCRALRPVGSGLLHLSLGPGRSPRRGPRCLRPGLYGRQGRRWPDAFAFGTLDAEERHSPQAPPPRDLRPDGLAGLTAGSTRREPGGKDCAGATAALPPGNGCVWGPVPRLSI